MSLKVSCERKYGSPRADAEANLAARRSDEHGGRGERQGRPGTSRLRRSAF